MWAMTTAEPRVLVVEDDDVVRRAVADGLSAHGFVVDAVPDAESAASRLGPGTDLIVLDVGLPGLSGLELCRRLRSTAQPVPILVLSARDAVTDRVAGLEAGADDYLVKPFDLSELVARLHALHRRAGIGPAATPDVRRLTVRGLVLDLDRRSAEVDGEALDLTRREFDLLATLVENRDLVLSRLTLLEKVWGYDFEVETNVVDVFVGYLRRKLAAAGRTDLIRTVRGVGFVVDGDRSAVGNGGR